MRTTLSILLLLAGGSAFAQAPQEPALGYNFAELRFVDVDVNGGDGLKLGGSFRFSGNWLAVGSLTRLNFNNDVDSTTLELGAGYVWPYRPDWDFLANVRIIRTDVDFPFGSADDTGVGLTGGVRGLIAPQFEVRGAVQHVSVDDSDTYLELAGDYYFTPNVAAGLSIEFGGDVDAWTIGARWYFR